MIDMYREHILEHYEDPQNFGELEHPTHKHKESNASCGDEITVYLITEDEIIKDVRFIGHGCAISMAATSLITERVKGKSVEAVMKMGLDDVLEALEIEVSPARMKCVTLGIKAIQKSLQVNDNE